MGLYLTSMCDIPNFLGFSRKFSTLLMLVIDTHREKTHYHQKTMSKRVLCHTQQKSCMYCEAGLGLKIISNHENKPVQRGNDPQVGHDWHDSWSRKHLSQGHSQSQQQQNERIQYVNSLSCGDFSVLTKKKGWLNMQYNAILVIEFIGDSGSVLL